MPDTPRQHEYGSAIAIIGLSCRFPGDAESPSKFWDMLKNGRDGFSQTTSRYNAEAFHHTVGGGNRQNVIPVKGGYLLKQDPYVFDAAFFNITAAEAMALDPRQRIAMEVAYEALENAGLPLQKVAGTQTACFMGASMSDYRDAVSRDFAHAPKYHILGISDEMISNRISHFLDIHGPSATVQTACSSSLVATHLACQSIRSGESEMAIAGGIGLIIGTDGTMHLNNVGFLNPAGHSMSFDESAGGYGRGEGCGVVIMKRLDAAIRDGNNIRAVVRASGVNSDGWTQGVTMPSMEAQAALIKYVYESNGLDYGATQYVEAHGTGTKVGDPIETRAIHSTIGQTTKTSSRKKLYIGSVKPNIGHLEAAAGAASIIKGVMALERGLIPPSIRYSKPNPSIPFDEWNMVVPTKLTPWPAAHTKRMSISGFGMGGTNAHVVMEAFNISKNDAAAIKTHKKRLFTFSSHDKAGFKRIGDTLIDHLDTLASAASSPAFLADLAHTLSTARSGLVWKAACFAENTADLREQLSALVGDAATRAPSSPPRLGFVFTGQGAQWARMGIELLGRRVFSQSVEQSTKILKELGADWEPIVELKKSAKESRLGVPEISQPICSVLQIALVDELRSWGVTPARVVGHSSGEIAAAYTIGALSHRDALAVAYFRGTASAGLREKQCNGGMMAVGCSRDEAHKLMTQTQLQATVACVNSPSNVTLSGDVSTLEALRAILEERGVFARRLKVDVAYHSPHMHLCSAEYYGSISDLGDYQEEESPKQQPITMVSSVTGTEIDPELVVPYYWVQNLTSPVLFVDAVQKLVAPSDANGEKAVDLLVEVGPHSALGGPIEQILSGHGVKNVDYESMLTRGKSALDTSFNLATELFRKGVNVDISKVNDDPGCRLLTDLPSYPWNHTEQFRADSRIQREMAAQKFATRSLLGAMMPTLDENERVWRSIIRLNDEPWLRGHIVGTTVLFPAAGMVSIVLEAAQQIADPRKTPLAFKLRDTSFSAAMTLPEDVATEITVHMRPHLLATSGSTPAAWWEFTVSSCAGPTGQMRDNCRGLLSIVYEEGRSLRMQMEDNIAEAAYITDYHRVLEECPEPCTKDFFYERMNKSALPYGEVFRGVEKCRPGSGQTSFEVDVTDIGETFTKGKLERPFLIHAATLDAVLQSWLGSTCTARNSNFGFDKPMVPASIGEFEISANIPGGVGYKMPGACRSHQHSFNEYSANINVFDTDVSKVLLSIIDFRTSPLEMDDAETADASGVTADVDAAHIASEIRWNFALELLTPAEITQVVAGTDVAETSTSGLVQLVEMIIHQQPALNVIELASNKDGLSTSVMSSLSSGIILPAQVQYAVIGNDEDGTDIVKVDDEVFGSAFRLGAAEAPLPAHVAPADLLIISQAADKGLGDSLDSVLDRLVLLAKPGALIILADSLKRHDDEELTPLALQNKGFKLVSTMQIGGGHLKLFKNSGSDKKQSDKLPESSKTKAIVVLEPKTFSTEAQHVSNTLQKMLSDQGYEVSSETGICDADTMEGKTCISLLELEGSIMENLSESDFQSMQKLVVKGERLLWLTCGDNPSFGIVDGFSRCVNGEVADAKFQVLHLSANGLQHGPSLALRILQSPDTIADNEFRETNGLLQVQRIYDSPLENGHIRDHLEDSVQVKQLSDEECLRLTIGKPGLLDSLHFARDERMLTVPLGDDEVELEVRATGVNFRDVMASMGLVPVTELGYEAGGIVLRAGSRAANSFQPGDRVSTMSVGGTHATKTRCDYRVTAKIPDTMSFEEAAAAPTVHATAYFALVKLAKLRQGQSVLLHAAAGGVGQAAVQLAQHLGLTTYITVGTEDKREFMMKHYGIPEEHIFNSRDTSFAKGIRRVTGGRGVDCVLNSLSGELLRVSWDCLATFGTFVEIGMRDITENTRLDMRPFGKTATFTFFEIPTLIKKDAATLGEALHEVFKLLEQGVLQVPSPMTVYPVGQVENAFRLMQQGKHRGKIVLSFSEEHKAKVPILCKAKDSLKLDPQATYLFVGGLGGLGRSLAGEFVASGARNLAFISRSGDDKPEARATVDELVAKGACVKVFRGDVADQASFSAAMKQCSQQLPAVKGVIQMAMVLRDTVIENMSYNDWTIPLRPKVQGTWNLHEYFGVERPLDFMVFCSSISGICGNPGQAQYDAGNTYQDTLAHYRRAQGLKAVSVNLGIMLDVGVIAESVEHNFKVWEQVLGIREPAFHALMKSVINSEQEKRGGNNQRSPAQVCVGLGTADILAAHRLPSPAWFKDARFGPLATASTQLSSAANGDNASASLASRLTEAGANKDQSTATNLVTGALVKKVAEILRIPATEVDPSRPLYTYGVDSLVALEVRNWITREIKANMALLDIMAAVPMEAFAGQIAQKSKLVMGAA